MVHALGQPAGGPAPGHGRLVPALGHNSRQSSGQEPARSRHRPTPQLAVGPLAQRARVLALHPDRAATVLGEAGVVHHPGGRLQRRAHHLGQPPADRPPVPRAGRDEVCSAWSWTSPSRAAIGPIDLRRPPAAARAASTARGRADRRAAATPTGHRRRHPGVGGFWPARLRKASHSLLPCAGTGGQLPHTLPINRRHDRALLIWNGLSRRRFGLVDGMVCGQQTARVGARDRCWVAVGVR
jgi:hypothetical protein